MKKITYYIITIFALSCCKKSNSNKIIHPKKEKVIINKEKYSFKKINLDSIKTIKTVYVTTKNGLSYRESPSLNSVKKGTFDIGTKLAVIEKTGVLLEIKDGKKLIKGEWLKVKSEMDRNDNYWFNKNYYKHSGYVFDGFLKDSSKVDFRKLPILFSYFSSERNIEYSKHQYNKLDLNFEEISKSEFLSFSQQKINIGKTKKNIIPPEIIGNEKDGSYFLLKTNKNLLKFPCGANHSRPCYYYNGFIEAINAHSITSLSEGAMESFLVDRDNSSTFFIPSPDSGDYGLHISPNNKKMVLFSSDDYQDKLTSYIEISDIENIKNLNDIKNIVTFTSKEWSIVSLNWVDDKSFVLDIFDKTKLDENNQRIPVNHEYLKVNIE